MLKYKIYLEDKNIESKEVQYESLYLASDRSFISGITKPFYGLNEVKSLVVENDTKVVCPINAYNIYGFGYVIYDKTYNVEQINGLYCVLYDDGQYYCANSGETITIDNHEYTMSGETITIPKKYWSYDNKIDIDGNVYDVIIDPHKSDDEDYYPHIILNDEQRTTLFVIDWRYTQREEVTIFQINQQYPIPLKIDSVIRKEWDSQNYIYNNVSSGMTIDICFGDKLPIITNFAYIHCQAVSNEEITSKNYYQGKKLESNVQYKYNFNGILLPFVDSPNNKNGISGYCINNNVLIPINDSENIITGYTYEIGGNIYISESSNYVTHLDNGGFDLEILEVIGNNTLRCYMPNNDQGANESIDELYAKMSSNPFMYIAEIVYPLFDKSYIAPIHQSNKSYIITPFKIYTENASYFLPIKLESDNATNLHQEYLIKNYFFDVEKEKRINNIVDMEKDVYHPSQYIKKPNKNEFFTLCQEIQIDLHFRSRNLENWVINDANDISDYGNKYPSNWNLFDRYRYENDMNPAKSFQPILRLNDDFKYYPPSDLLYFLNFTNDDVFYQKQKIGKSFLRLSFYDSNHPYNSNLLYTTTVFMSETNLFNTYINADKTQSLYANIGDRGITKTSQNGIIYDMVDNQNIVKNISVSTEPCQSDNANFLTFDESKRLSCKFTIKNRYTAVDSSEGFYLYLFKELTNGLHERTIYLKIEFNHAGLGKTVKFMQMYETDYKGDKHLIDWSQYENYDKYKDGYTLEEIQNHLYIEVKIRYDEKNKCFCYYFPQWMSEFNSDKNIMKLNLFEIKIKNES